jgi:hypothetical protein
MNSDLVGCRWRIVQNGYVDDLSSSLTKNPLFRVLSFKDLYLCRICAVCACCSDEASLVRMSRRAGSNKGGLRIHAVKALPQLCDGPLHSLWVIGLPSLRSGSSWPGAGRAAPLPRARVYLNAFPAVSLAIDVPNCRAMTHAWSFSLIHLSVRGLKEGK